MDEEYEDLYRLLLALDLIAPSTVSGWRKGEHPKWVDYVRDLRRELEESDRQIQERDDYIAKLERALIRAAIK